MPFHESKGLEKKQGTKQGLRGASVVGTRPVAAERIHESLLPGHIPGSLLPFEPQSSHIPFLWK